MSIKFRIVKMTDKLCLGECKHTLSRIILILKSKYFAKNILE